MLTVGGRKVQIVADITLCKNNGFNIVMIGKFPKCKTSRFRKRVKKNKFLLVSGVFVAILHIFIVFRTKRQFVLAD